MLSYPSLIWQDYNIYNTQDVKLVRKGSNIAMDLGKKVNT